MIDNSYERWRPVVSFGGLYADSYEVSDLGRVRSLTRTLVARDGRARVHRGRVLKPSKPQRRSYPSVVLSPPRRTAHLHTLVLEAFVGPRPSGYVGRHRNDDPSDNRLANLVYGTASQNNYDAVSNGLHYWANQAACKWGHLFAGANLRIMSTRRMCVACARAQSRAWKMRKSGREVDEREMADEIYTQIMAA